MEGRARLVRLPRASTFVIAGRPSSFGIRHCVPSGPPAATTDHKRFCQLPDNLDDALPLVRPGPAIPSPNAHFTSDILRAFRYCFISLLAAMADPKEPKKETVRIALPPRPPGAPSAARAPGSETVRINMPARPPANGAPRPPAPPSGGAPRPPMSKTPLPPAPAKAVAPPPLFRPSPASASPSSPSAPRPATPPTAAGLASAAGPKKETARISVAPAVPARPGPAIQMKKTQPLVTMPEPVRQTAPIAVNVAPIEEEEGFIEGIPMPLCWAALAFSAIILTIQIWNYLT